MSQDDANEPEPTDEAVESNAEIPIEFVANTDTSVNYPNVGPGIPVKFVADSDTLTCTAAQQTAVNQRRKEGKSELALDASA